MIPKLENKTFSMKSTQYMHLECHIWNHHSDTDQSKLDKGWTAMDMSPSEGDICIVDVIEPESWSVWWREGERNEAIAVSFIQRDHALRAKYVHVHTLYVPLMLLLYVLSIEGRVSKVKKLSISKWHQNWRTKHFQWNPPNTMSCVWNAIRNLIKSHFGLTNKVCSS